MKSSYGRTGLLVIVASRKLEVWSYPSSVAVNQIREKIT